MNYASLISWASARHPDRPAVRFEDSTLSYRELDCEVRVMAQTLRAHGLVSGDRVALMMSNCPQFVVAFWGGALRAGCVVVPMNPLFQEREVDYYLKDSGTKAFIHSESVLLDAGTGAVSAGQLHARWTVRDHAPQTGEPLSTDLEAAMERVRNSDLPPSDDLTLTNADDPAVLLYTSGTTGRPKGAILTHSNLTANVSVFSSRCLQITEEDVVFGGALPLFHSFGQTLGMGSAFAAGACLSLLGRFSPDAALKLIAEQSVTIMLGGVPTMYTAILNAVDEKIDQLSTLRVCVSGGAAASVELLRQLQDKTGCTVLEGYGLSETSPAASFNHPDRPAKAGSIGTPIWGGTEMRIVDSNGNELLPHEVGEIQIRGHNVMAGYHNKPDETQAAFDSGGWFRTGDIGYIDTDGYYFIIDRKKDLIIRGGYNVYPREIEEVLYEHPPSVLEAAVIGTPPHGTLGEEIVAVVTVKPGHVFDSDDLQKWCKNRLAAFKYPRTVLQTSVLPKGATGKILKREIEIPETIAATYAAAGS